MKFTVKEAQAYATMGRIEEWVHCYLMAGSWQNPGLSTGLKKQTRYWAGPVEMALADLTRCCGPERQMEFRTCPVLWQVRTAEMSASINSADDLPPLIIHYLPTELSIRDGNHRHEALRLKGFLTCWVLIWYDSVQEMLAHVEDTAHPITAGLRDWEMTDETYGMASPGADSHPLSSVDHPNSMRTVAWTRQYKESRVFGLSLGHDNESWQNESFKQVLRNGIAWCANKPRS